VNSKTGSKEQIGLPQSKMLPHSPRAFEQPPGLGVRPPLRRISATFGRDARATTAAPVHVPYARPPLEVETSPAPSLGRGLSWPEFAD